MATGRYNPEERLSIIRHVDDGRTVSDVCQEFEISRAIFYRWRDRYAAEGLQGLIDRPPVHKSDATKTPERVVKAIIAAARGHPQLGCRDIAALVSRACPSVSYTKVQAVLNEARLGTKRDRWLNLEDAYYMGYSRFSKAQLEFIISWNPSFRERHLRCFRPAQNVTAATFYLPRSTGLSRHSFVAVIDNYSSFTYINSVSRPDDAYLIIVEALALFTRMGRPPSAIFTDDTQPYSHRNKKLAAALRPFNVDHFTAEMKMRGFVERFRLWLIDRLRDPQARRVSFHALLEDYNCGRVFGFPNYGLTPAALFIDGVYKERKQTARQR